MSNRPRRFQGTDVLVVIGVALLYVACAKLGLLLAFRAAQVTAVWPPTAFALVAVLRLGWRAVPGILAGAFIANVTADEPAAVAAGIAIGNTLEAVTGVWLLRGIGFDGRLARVHDVIALLCALAVSPVVSATIGVASLTFGGVHPSSAAPELWWIWWIGDALGGLILAPAMLVWSDRGPLRLTRAVVIEGALLLTGVVIATLWVFARPGEAFVTAYVVFPFLIWAALRLGPVASATVIAVANVIAVWGTHLGVGPFAGIGPEGGLVPLQIFMAVAATTGLLLAAITAQNRLLDQRKDEFLAMLAHELRNPLAPILHAATLLDSGDAPDARRIIERQSRHLSRLVDDLLDVARITRGTVRVERRPITVGEIVEPAVETWRHAIEQKKQVLVVDVPSEAIGLDGDPVRLTQVIANLIHNASKFTPEGGRIEVSAARENGTAFIRVRDSGRGMSPELLAHAFDVFVQERSEGGLGLGLTLVRRLVEMHDGSVEVKSEGEGRGSELIVRLPIADPWRRLSGGATDAPAESRRHVSARRVLLVEDNADARQILALLLTRAGHDVRTASDGPSALAEAAAFAPEVVLLDIGLPGMDGYAVARQLRALPACAGARVIALTGYGQVEGHDFDAHLVKPVESARLMEVLD